ncbi:hypothetical protein DXG01_012260 [Tephrocybe rancida]|nr:hypothetical protein DXG01_012260 [Tephrocybe rancida]
MDNFTIEELILMRTNILDKPIKDQTTPGTTISLGTGYEVDIDFTQQKKRVYELRNEYTWHKVE